MRTGYDCYNSPIGLLYVVVDELGVKRIELTQDGWDEFIEGNHYIGANKELCKDAIIQLDEYFNGKRRSFDLTLSIEGTTFRKKVWEALLNIPYGEVRSYGDIAESINNPKAVRAVGQANRANPIPIIIPCHRVIGKNGSLVGYAGNKTHMKEILLKLEGVDIKGL